MDDFWLVAIFVAVPFVLWYIVKRMIYAAFYVAKKAMEGAKNRPKKEE